MMDIPTIAKAASLIAARQLSPVDLVESCLERIEALDVELNSFVTLAPERARRDARSAEARMMSGNLRGRLDGIPIAHKDVFATKGIVTTAQSRFLQAWVPDADAHVVSRLDAAGSILLGKLATHEFALGGPAFDLPWPPARNPWNTDHFASGSSSGTAVALAAGLILGGTGTDTAGSIRGPAALCGVVGLKPTYGLCSRRGILPLAFTLDHAGPMAWTVEDCALLLEAMAGCDATDPASVDRRVPQFTAQLGRDLAGVRVGIVPHWHQSDHPVSEAVRMGIDRALAACQDAGAIVVELAMPSLFEYQAANFVILASEAFALHEPWMRARFSDYGERLRDRVALGGLLSSADYIQALRRRRELCTASAMAAAEVDVIVTASAPGEAPRLDNVSRWGDLAQPGFNAPFNLIGWPAISVPSGTGEGGLPVAVQAAGKPFREPLLLQVAFAIERAVGFRPRPFKMYPPPF